MGGPHWPPTRSRSGPPGHPVSGRLGLRRTGLGERLAQVELKAKHQPYRGWGHLRPELAEADLLFVLDELALRKIVEAGRYAYLVVADLPSARWCVWSTVELVLASKVRTVRTLVTGTTRLKAKVLLDLRRTRSHHCHRHRGGRLDRQLPRPLRPAVAHYGPWPTGPAVREPSQEDLVTAPTVLLTLDEAQELLGFLPSPWSRRLDQGDGRGARGSWASSRVSRTVGAVTRSSWLGRGRLGRSARVR